MDAFAPEEDVNWGHEPEWLKDDRHHQQQCSSDGESTGLEEPLGAVQMGLIYVNPVSLMIPSIICYASSLTYRSWVIRSNILHLTH